MRFIDDVNLRARLGAGGVHRAFPEVARIIDAAVGGGVELHDVEIGGTGPNAAARIAHAAGLAGGRALLAVQGHCEDASRGGLAHTARSGKEVPVRDAALGNGAAERSGNVVLDDEVGELLGAILSGEGDH